MKRITAAAINQALSLFEAPEEKQNDVERLADQIIQELKELGIFEYEIQGNSHYLDFDHVMESLDTSIDSHIHKFWAMKFKSDPKEQVKVLTNMHSLIDQAINELAMITAQEIIDDGANARRAIHRRVPCRPILSSIKN